MRVFVPCLLVCVWMMACSEPTDLGAPRDGGAIGDGGANSDAGTNGDASPPPPTCETTIDVDHFDVDIPAVSVSGHITVNGAEPGATTGFVYLRNTTTGDGVPLGSTGYDSYAPRLIVPGTYDVFYRSNGADEDDDVPLNEAALVKSAVSITATGVLDVDIPAVSVSGHITVNGAEPGATTGFVYLRNATTGDGVPVGSTGYDSYAPRLIVPGTYDVFYRSNGADEDDDVPLNEAARIGCAKTP